MTALDNPVQIVQVTAGIAEVRVRVGRVVTSIGKVGSANGRWFWQHRDGEQSSAIASTRSDAAEALANYHAAFKRPAAPATPERHLLFG